MKKIAYYEIRFTVNPSGPGTGYVRFRLEGESNFTTTPPLNPDAISALAAILVDEHVYYSSGEFVRNFGTMTP